MQMAATARKARVLFMVVIKGGRRKRGGAAATEKEPGELAMRLSALFGWQTSDHNKGS